MVNALYVERSTMKTTYAVDAAEAIDAFIARGIHTEAVKEIGTDTWTEPFNLYRVSWNDGEAHYSRVFTTEEERATFVSRLYGRNITTWEN